MGKKQADERPAETFLSDLFDTLPGGFIEIRIKEDKADGKIVKRSWCQSYEAVNSLLEKYGEKDNRYAFYFGVAKRANKGREVNGKTVCTKQDVLGATCLWADIDTAKHGWSMQETARHLYNLPLILQPTALVNSGGGLHAYWVLTHPIDAAHNTAEIEDLNELLQKMVSSDRIHDTTRVLRLPGSFNCKNVPKPVETIWFHRWDRKDVQALWNAAHDFGKVLGPDGFVAPEDMPKEYRTKREIDVMAAFNNAIDSKRNKAKRFEELWESTRPGGGYPYYGIDEAELLGTCLLYFTRDITDPIAKRKNIVDRVFEKVREVMMDNDPSEFARWDHAAEIEKIGAKYDRWADKWKLLEAQLKKQKAADRKAAKSKV